VTVNTTARPVQLSQLRSATEAFASRLFGLHVTKANALEVLVMASFVRGPAGPEDYARRPCRQAS
jgi:hypothetical protein